MEVFNSVWQPCYFFIRYYKSPTYFLAIHSNNINFQLGMYFCFNRYKIIIQTYKFRVTSMAMIESDKFMVYTPYNIDTI